MAKSKGIWNLVCISRSRGDW